MKHDIGVYWLLLRPFTLTASIVPLAVGTILAAHDGAFHWGLCMLAASVLIQAATNIFNEYYNYQRV